MIIIKKIGIFIILILLITPNFAQKIKIDSLIKFTGVVVDNKDLNPIRQTNIINKNRRKGTTADEKGLFEFLARKNDTIIFSSVGYKTLSFIVPDTITQLKYSLFQIMTQDTLLLPETVIHPFPTLEKLKQAIAEMKTEEEIQKEIVKKNLAPVKEQISSLSYQSDASMNFRKFIQNETRKLYYNGQVQPMPIFDIFAWGKFVKAWKKGKFKKKD